LAAGLRPDPLGELMRSRGPLAAMGHTSERGKGRGVRGLLLRGTERRIERGQKGREREFPPKAR